MLQCSFGPDDSLTVTCSLGKNQHINSATFPTIPLNSLWSFYNHHKTEGHIPALFLATAICVSGTAVGLSDYILLNCTIYVCPRASFGLYTVLSLLCRQQCVPQHLSSNLCILRRTIGSLWRGRHTAWASLARLKASYYCRASRWWSPGAEHQQCSHKQPTVIGSVCSPRVASTRSATFEFSLDQLRQCHRCQRERTRPRHYARESLTVSSGEKDHTISSMKSSTWAVPVDIAP